MALLIPFCIISFLLFGHRIEGSIVESTCKGTPNYLLCVKTLQKDPRSASADVRGLGLIMVDNLKAKTAQTMKSINTLKKTNPHLQGPLSQCARVYDAVLKADIPEAVEALTKGDPKFAENGVADAAIEAQECDRGFKGSKPVLANMNKAIQDLSNVARAIIRMLL